MRDQLSPERLKQIVFPARAEARPSPSIDRVASSDGRRLRAGWLLLVVAAILGAALGVGSATSLAAPYTWDPNGTSGANPGGSGIWDAISNFWYDGGSDTTWVNDGTSTAIFSGT